MSLGLALYLTFTTTVVLALLVVLTSASDPPRHWWEFETTDLVFEMGNGDSIQGSVYRRTFLNYYIVSAYAYDAMGNAHQMIGERVKLPRSKVVYIQAVATDNGTDKV